MTLINKLRLYGFKSFAKPTDIVFPVGFSCVIGANGSGKSNIPDGICFVLGRISAKAMRAEKSANLIFNGGKKGSPMKEAEVSIFFDNSKKEFPIDLREVKVTRIVRHNGNSIYKINDETVTRQQVVELLSRSNIDPDGHNIVLQGEIIHFIEMHPEERRQMIENVAGISVYEDKKHHALLELEKVDQKISEASIILNERGSYLKELKKERDQALKFKELEERIKDNKATFYHLQIKEKEEKKSKLENKIKSHEDELTKLNERINGLKTEINTKKEEIKNIERDIERKGEEEQIKLRDEIENLKTGMATDAERLNQIVNEIAKIKERNLQLKDNLRGIDKKIFDLGKDKEELNKKSRQLVDDEKNSLDEIKKFKEKHGINDAGDFEKKILEIENEIEKKLNEISWLHQEKNNKLIERGKLEFNLSSINEKLNIDKSGREDGLKLKNIREELKRVESEINKISDEGKIIYSQLNNLRGILKNNNEEFERLRIKEISNKEGLLNDAAVKKILNAKLKGVHGTISDLGEVDSKYSLALDIAAGARIKSIVVEDDKTAIECINMLKESKSGVATFLPLNKIKAQSSNELRKIRGEDCYGLAIDLIKFDSKFEDAFSYVFGNTLIVKDDSAARKIGIGRCRIVTLDGNLFEGSGAIIGGYRIRTSGSFKEIGMGNKIEALEKEIFRLRNEITELEDKRIKNDDKFTEVRNNKYNLEGDKIKIERSLGIVNVDELKKQEIEIDKKFKEINNTIKDIENKINKKEDELNELKNKKNNVRERLSKFKRPEFAGLDKLIDKQSGFKENILSISLQIKNIDENVSNIHLPEKEKILSILKEQEKDFIEFQNKKSELEEKIKDEKEKLKKEEANEKKFYSDYKELFVKKDKINCFIQKIEGQVDEHGLKIKEIEKSIGEISINKAEIAAGLNALLIEFENWKDGKIINGKSVDELNNEIKKFEKMRLDIGSVNMRALEIYEGIEKEYSELVGKSEKLKTEKNDVLIMMQEIEGKKRDAFMKTFEVIKNNFEGIFVNLTTKGTAHMVLENEEDPLNGGIEIRVKIASNKYLDIRGLSGGEKTLAALAFIFAIQEYQPASFYLLDEVDAALDKTNSNLLSKLVSKYSKNAQYIMISHNDDVITEASQIYGVSMQENGISKIVSLKFDENKD